MFYFFDQSQDNVVVTTRRLLRLLKVKVNNSTLSQTLQEHPDYPSLWSVLDSLHTWKVESMGIKASFEELINLSCPLLAHLKTNQLLVVIDVNSISVTYLNEQYKKRQLTQEEFIKQWDGVVLLAEADEHSGEGDYAQKHRWEILRRLPMPVAFLTALILIVLTAVSLHRTVGIQSLFPFLLSLSMLAGTAVVGLLLWYEIDMHNPLLQKICTASKHVDCSAILQSDAAKLWSIITWSEVGLAYFTGGFFSLLLSSFDPTVITIIAWLNLLATPYIFFSVFYQWRIAKQWCLLCLTVQFLLLGGFIICLTGKYYTVYPHTISLHYVILFMIAYGLPLLLWRQLKPLWLKAKDEKHYKRQLLRMKHDIRIFDALLTKQKNISTKDIQHLGILLGNVEAKHHLVKVCNPYCGPCARVHPEIEKILEANQDISAQIIFTPIDDERDLRSYAAKHLMAIDEKGNKELTKKALDDWYNAPKKDYQVFANKYPLNGELQAQGEKLKSMSEWCKKIGITFTPTFFVDGYQLPEIYEVDDLRYLLAV